MDRRPILDALTCDGARARTGVLCSGAVAEEKRTKIGPTAPRGAVRETGAQAVADAAGTPIPASTPPGATPAVPTSYLPPLVDPLLGQTVAARYLIQKKLGEGGMGAVYLATHVVLDKQVALKVLHGEFLRKADLVERFMQEAKSASRIRHENVIDISDFGTTPDGLVFFAMELLKGHDLHEEVSRAKLTGHLLPWERTKKIYLQICAALVAAHAQGIIHRDLKPENIFLIDFLGDPDFVKLLDFGIAKLTEVEEGGRKLTKTGMLFGTPEYMSPEQARGENVDHRVDVYAMGCILFQLVSGKVPFEADNFMGVLSMHLTEPSPSIPPEVFDRIGAPRELAAVIDKALAKDKHQRWSTIEELANAVRQVCGDPLRAGSTTSMPRGRTPSVVAPATTTQARQRTQWTGNAAVPTEEDPAPARPAPRSKLPLILGALAVVGGGAVAAMLLLGGGGRAAAPVTPVGAAGSAAGVAAAVPAPVPPDAPALPPLPERVKIKIDSKPHGAEVADGTGRTLGRTPITLDLKAARTELSFSLRLRGYGDTLVALVPDQDLAYVADLEKGVAGGPPKRQTVPTTAPNTPAPTTPVTSPPPPTPGEGSARTVAPTEPGPVTTPTVTPVPTPVVPTAPTDDCPGDEPCLKQMPSEHGGT